MHKGEAGRGAGVAWTLAVALALSMGAAAGCSGDATSGPGEDGKSLDAVSDVASDAASDAAADGGGPGEPDATGDAAGDGGADPDGADGGDAGPTPGGFGWPCDDNGQCASGFCVESYDGRVCTQTCSGDCPSGFSCRQDLASFPDIVYVCVPTWPRLCYPCAHNDDCVLGDGGAADACVSAGLDGAFCGGSCADKACPPGFFCGAVPDVDGKVSKQCVPESGECACPASAVTVGASTTCWVESELGVCPGARTCTADGLTACDAPTPAEDACNGVDDDCDGQTDEAFVAAACEVTNEHGTCAGQSTCQGAAGAVCDAATPGAEVCDGVDNDCDGETDEGGSGCTPYWADVDGDGYGVGEPQCLCGPEGELTAKLGGDCAPEAANVHPGAAEACNDIDDDCNGVTDDAGAQGCSLFQADVDGDGYGSAGEAACLCAPEAPYVTKDATDCDDGSADVSPGALETCNGVDDDCDGLTDEPGASDCTLHYIDEDGDGHGEPTSFACLCAPDETYVTTLGGDCDDGDAQRHPGAAEACNGQDDDCDGLVDEPGAAGCVAYMVDGDGDGYGLSASAQCLCAPAGALNVTVGGDCNDAVGAVHPGAAETCNGQDDDCDGGVDEAGAEGCVVMFMDADQDSFGQAGDSACLCVPTLPYVATNDLDCDDGNPFANPDGVEVCNGADDDCDGQTDEGVGGTCSPFYRDEDGDGWGDADDSQCLCAPQGKYTAIKPGDCDDAAASTHPFALEQCGGGVDDDCDGETDEAGGLGCVLHFRDQDGDGFGVLQDFQCLCAPSGVYATTQPGDCDDGDGAIHPGGGEVCNGVDDDCDGSVDEPGASGCTDYLRDSDRDGFGVAGETECLCAGVAPFDATVGGDCNDSDAGAFPGGLEVCDGIDNDCNGAADDPGTSGCHTFYRDDDGDTWGVAGDAQCLCAPKGAYVATSAGDCDDGDAGANPAALEVCNGLDDDCDGSTDEAGSIGCAYYMKDGDGDGYGVLGDVQCLCEPGGAYTATVPGDCDDGSAQAHPGGVEACGGGDDDCDGVVDEPDALGCTTYYKDLDGDGYGVAGDTRCLCQPTAPYAGVEAGDCNDSSALIGPGQAEFCNGADDDCDGLTDEVGSVGCTVYYTDLDGDGWGTGAGSCLCKPVGFESALNAPDCADEDPARNPGKPEACNDGVDDDCDGLTDEAGAVGCIVYYLDADEDGYGVTSSATCLCAPEGDVDATLGGDCYDDDPAANPDVAEVCNGIDDDCDGVFDEGCGLATTGWPRMKYDARLTGTRKDVQGPDANTLRWKRQLAAGWEAEVSPLILADGNILVRMNDRVWKLDAASGDTLWSTQLPAGAYKRSSPLVREGGTIVTAVGNGVAMLDPQGVILWTTSFPGAATDQVAGSITVDDAGDLYMVSNKFMYKVSAGGAVQWQLAVPNAQDTASHIAIGPTTGRLYFGATNHAMYAVEPTGTVAWTFVVGTKDIDSSVAVGADGSIYLVFEDILHRVRDDGIFGTSLGNVDVGPDTDTDVIVYNTGADNFSGTDYVYASPNGNNGVKKYSTALSHLATLSMVKHDAPGATGVFDQDGDLYMGTDDGKFVCARQTGATSWQTKWAFNTDASHVDGAAAIGQGFVVFTDDSGRIYLIGD